MNTEYPLRPLDGKSFDKCVCGHESCWHEITTTDTLRDLFKSRKASYYTGKCEVCMCPKFQKEVKQ